MGTAEPRECQRWRITSKRKCVPCLKPSSAVSQTMVFCQCVTGLQIKTWRGGSLWCLSRLNVGTKVHPLLLSSIRFSVRLMLEDCWMGWDSSLFHLHLHTSAYLVSCGWKILQSLILNIYDISAASARQELFAGPTLREDASEIDEFGEALANFQAHYWSSVWLWTSYLTSSYCKSVKPGEKQNLSELQTIHVCCILLGYSETVWATLAQVNNTPSLPEVCNTWLVVHLLSPHVSNSPQQFLGKQQVWGLCCNGKPPFPF